MIHSWMRNTKKFIHTIFDAIITVILDHKWMVTLSLMEKSSTVKYNFPMKFGENLIAIVDELIESQSQSGKVRLLEKYGSCYY